MNVTQPGRIYRGVGPRERQAERRTRLIDAAIEVFGTTGYRIATVDQVCTAAGLTKRYFYESFADSEALLLAAYGRVIDDLQAELAAVVRTDDVDTTTRVMLAEFFARIDADPRRARLIFFEILGISPAVDAAYRAATGRFIEMVRELGGPALAGSRFGPAQQVIAATGLVGSILMIAQVWVLDGRRTPIESIVETAHALVTAVLDASA
jgi:AcrR family transcriptional regulator